MTIIGFMGNKCSGKTTCANYLAGEYEFIVKSFADPLKIACAAIFCLTPQQLYGDLKETPDERWDGCTPRTMMQFLGTDLLRNQTHKIIPDISQNIFVKNFSLWYKQEIALNPDLKIVLQDVRFQNEVDMIHSFNGIVIKLENNKKCNDDHESEKICVTGYDFLIHNDSTFHELYRQIDEVIQKI